MVVLVVLARHVTCVLQPIVLMVWQKAIDVGLTAGHL